MPASHTAQYASSESASGIGRLPRPSNPLDRRQCDGSEFGGMRTYIENSTNCGDVAKPVRRDVPVYSEWIGAPRSSTSTPKSMLAPVLGLIPMALVPEPGSDQRTLLTCVILGPLTGSCMVTVFLVPTAHRLIHRKDVRDDEIEPRSGEVIYA
jgi:hypothetical protein